MERLEWLLDIRLPSISKPTISLFFGLLISLVSGVLLLTAMCSQTWAVRQETILLQQQQVTRVPSHGSGTVKLDSGDSQDTDSRVQIKVPVEVPSLQVMLERNEDVMPQFYEGRLNELYAERLNELTREAQSENEPHSSPLLYKPSVKLKTEVVSEITSTSIEDETGVLAPMDNSDQKIKISAKNVVPPNEGYNTTANERRVHLNGEMEGVIRQSGDLSSDGNVYTAGVTDLKNDTVNNRKTSSAMMLISNNNPKNRESKISRTNETMKSGFFINTSANKKVHRVVRSQITLRQPLKTSRDKFTIMDQLPLRHINFVNVLQDVIHLCRIFNIKRGSIFNKFETDIILPKLLKNESLKICAPSNFVLNCSEFLSPLTEILLQSLENYFNRMYCQEKRTEFSSKVLHFVPLFFQSQPQSVELMAVKKQKQGAIEDADYDLRPATQPDTNSNKLFFDNGEVAQADASSNKLLFSDGIVTQPATPDNKQPFTIRAVTEPGLISNKMLFSNGVVKQPATTVNKLQLNSRAAPLQQWQQRKRSFEKEFLTFKQLERRRRSPLEEFLRPHGSNRLSTGRRPEIQWDNFRLLDEGSLPANARRGRLKKASPKAGMKGILSVREEIPQLNRELLNSQPYLEAGRRHRRSLEAGLREPTDLKYTVCLWRVCITTTKRRSNTTTLCWSVLSNTASSDVSSFPLTSSPVALLTSLRYACAAVIAASAMLCLASSITLRALLMERHTHAVNCHNVAAPASTLPHNAATPVTGSTPDSAVVIKSPSLNSTSSTGGQHRNFQFKSGNDASAQSTDEASCSATEASGPWLDDQQQNQILLPVASALFAISGITMGGGIFKFCSAMTEKSITSTNDGGHFSRMSTHLSTTLHWPLLLASNCVVGCFLAALAIGYTFFLTWDKQILNFLNTGTSNDNLIIDQPYDRATNERKSLCDRCKTKSSTVIDEVAKSLEENSLAPYQCCQVEYCCNNPTIRHHRSHCIPHTHDVHFAQSLRRQPCMRIDHSYHYPARCSQCLKGRDTQFDGSSRMPVSSPLTPNNICSSKFEDTCRKFWSTELHANYNPHLHQNMDNYPTLSIDRHHHRDEFFPLPIDSISTQKTVNEAERQIIKVCDDPICQREQLRFHRPQSFAEGRPPQQLESNVQISRPKELIKYNDNRAANVRWKPSFDNKKIFSDGEVEHMYSNFITPNDVPSFLFPRHPVDRFCIDTNASSCSTHCACDQCSADLSLGAAQTDWNRSYIHMGHKEQRSRQYSVSREKSTASAIQFPHQSISSLRNSNYSTLPAKFSAKDSFFYQEGRIHHANREFKSCLNITETSVSSFDLIKNGNGEINGNSKQNSSAPSLKAKLDDFDKRKLVKTVKFITPDDEDSDSDSDYYIKKPTLNNIKKIRRDFLAPDGSSPIRELCGNSPLYR